MIKNKVGLEFEFLLRDKKGNLVFPEDYGFETDDFIILGEERVKPGKTRGEVIGNFYDSLRSVKIKAALKGLDLDLSGHTLIDTELNNKIMKRMKFKEISIAKNIYGTEILEDTDLIIEGKKIKGRNISCGLHIHFSSTQTNNNKAHVETIKTGYSPIINLYKKDKRFAGRQREFVEAVASVSRITTPVIKWFVTYFDSYILPEYKEDTELKFRQPGFYEIKSHGFEYRSLPFNKKVIKNMVELIDISFKLLEDLDI